MRNQHTQCQCMEACHWLSPLCVTSERTEREEESEVEREKQGERRRVRWRERNRERGEEESLETMVSNNLHSTHILSLLYILYYITILESIILYGERPLTRVPSLPSILFSNRCEICDVN